MLMVRGRGQTLRSTEGGGGLLADTIREDLVQLNCGGDLDTRAQNIWVKSYIVYDIFPSIC